MGGLNIYPKRRDVLPASRIRRLQPCDLRLGALRHHRQIPPYVLAADHVRVCFAGFAHGHDARADRGVVELGVVGHQDGRTRLLGHARELALRVGVDRELFRILVDELERGAAGVGHGHGLAVILHREQERCRARRVARRADEGDGGIAEGDLLAVGGDDVALGLAARHVGLFLDAVPIGPAHDQPWRRSAAA